MSLGAKGLSSASASNKYPVATCNSPIIVGDKLNSPPSNKPTASTSRPFHAASLSPLPPISQEILSYVRHSTAGSAKIINACPNNKELEEKRTSLLTKARNGTVISNFVTYFVRNNRKTEA
jgi:hypothetical protein